MNQPNQPNPKQGMPNKQSDTQKSGQQTQQGNRPGQGGQSAPTDKK
jgi:hypothetical protein